MVRALSAVPRFAALGSLFVTVAGFIVIVAGLAKLQKATNHLGALDDATSTSYSGAFNSALITPYPADHQFQFSFIWFIIFGNLFTVLFAAAVLAIPSLHIGRGAALTFIAIITTLTINVVNNLVFIHKNAGNAPISTVYKKRDIDVTLAGALLVVLGQVLTILLLGFWEPWRTLQGPNYYGTNKAATGHANVGVPQAQTGVAHAETRV